MQQFIRERVRGNDTHRTIRAGTTLKISAALPATYDVAGFSALSYTTVAEVTDMGSLGKVYDLVDHRPTNDRKKYKFKG